MNDLLGLLSAFQKAFTLHSVLQEKQNTGKQPEWQQRGKRIHKPSQISAAQQEPCSLQLAFCRALPEGSAPMHILLMHKSAILTGCSLNVNARKAVTLLAQKVVSKK